MYNELRSSGFARKGAVSLVAFATLCAATLSAQAPGPGVPASPQPAASAPQASTPPFPPMDKVTLDEAVRRALANNPTLAQAATAVLRAEGLLQQARAAILPTANATYSNVTVNDPRELNGIVTQPRNQSTFSVDIGAPVLAASRWAAATQARDQIDVATLSTADVRKQIGVATAQAYLAVIGQRRQLEVNQRAREAAQAHLDYANRRLAQGAGTRLNQLRAAQEVATDDARIEAAWLAVRRAQEALGVLVAADGPVDADGEPAFDVPAAQTIDEAGWTAARPDLRLSLATQRAFERIWRDSYKDYFPTAVALFTPQALNPSGAFNPARSWRFGITVSQPLFDAWQRRGLAKTREAAAGASKLALTALQIQARSEVRLAQETVASTERALANVRLSSQQANEVLSISNTAFEAGATTNLEVIDAERSARDAESAVAIAEDAVRTARLNLLVALGRFPQ